MGEPAEITVVFGDGAVPGTRTFVKPFSQIDARAHGLAAGASPTASISGSDTTPILSLGIPKGDRGLTGPKGDPGPRGLPGPKGEPGGSEDAIAEYFRRATSRPMQALAELGVPAPYASKTAIDARRGSSVGELARDTSSGTTYAWNGSTWKVWEALNLTNLITAKNPWWELAASSSLVTVRSGIVHARLSLKKAGAAWQHGAWDSDPCCDISAQIRPAAESIAPIPALLATGPFGAVAKPDGSTLDINAFGTDREIWNGAAFNVTIAWPTL